VVSKVIRRSFEEWKGLHKGFSDLTRPGEYATKSQNAVITDKFEIEQRKGGKVANETSDNTAGWRGIFNYPYISSGIVKEELIVVDGNSALSVITTGTLTITNSSVSNTYAVTFAPNSSNVWELSLAKNGGAATTTTYGTGIELVPSTVSTLLTDIKGFDTDLNTSALSASTGFSGSGIPAAAVDVINNITVAVSSNITASFKYGAAANGPNPENGIVDLSGTIDYGSNSFDPDFTNASFVGVNDVAFFCLDRSQSNNFGLWKYDGIAFYQAGLPKPPDLSSGETGAGANFVSGSVYKYRVRYRRQDGRGNIIEGNLSEIFSHTTAAAVTTIDLTIGQLARATTDEIAYNPRSAIANGTQTGTSITVDTGNSLQAGDVIYWNNAAFPTQTYKNTTIVSVTDTNVTVTNSITVQDNDVISNDLRIEIWRTKADSNIFYLVDEIPNDGANTTITYNDEYTDATIGVLSRLILPAVARDIPPPRPFNTTHQGLIFLAGGDTKITGTAVTAISDPLFANRVFFSDVTSPEYFPASTHFIDIPFNSLGPITAVASDGQRLIVFKKNARAIVHGDFVSNDLFAEAVEDGVGCPSHASIARGEKGLYFCSNKGPQRLVDGVLDFEFNLRLASDFSNQQYTQTSGTAITTAQQSLISAKKATGFYDHRNKRYLLFVPAETGTPGTVLIPNSNSKWYIYEEKVDAWHEWVMGETEMNAIGGFAIHGNKLYWSGEYNPTGNDTYGNIFVEKTANDLYDAADNTQPIDFDVRAQWDSAEQPSVYKKFLRERTWQMNEGNFISLQMNEDNFVAFTLALSTYLEYSTAATDTSLNQSFSTSTTKQVRSKLKAGKARALQVAFANSTLHEAPRITGYELEVAIPFTGGELKDKQ